MNTYDTEEALISDHGVILWAGFGSDDTRLVITSDGSMFEWIPSRRTVYPMLANKWVECAPYYDEQRKRLYIGDGAYAYGWKRPLAIRQQNRVVAHAARMRAIWG